MIEPITFNSHYVTYKVIKDDKVIKSNEHAACFSDIFRFESILKLEIELLDFLRIETSTYASKYIKTISKICDVKTIFISENHIRVSGFKNKFLMKTFLTMYRLLFESNKIYGYTTVEEIVKQRILFFEAFVNKNERCSYRCNLKKFIHFHNLYIKNTLGNSNHCIKNSIIINIKLKSKSMLLNYTTSDSVHSFFN